MAFSQFFSPVFFRLFTGNKWLARMGSDFDFFAFMDTVFTLVFFPMYFFPRFFHFLHTSCFLVFYIYAMPYFLVILHILFHHHHHHHLLSIVFFGGRKGNVSDKMPKVLEVRWQLSLSFPLIMVCHTSALL
ncbi:hypothetical protein L873DRAFT_747042 [Choiromyces venosus 120613-1]|uniref:Uncharacterized protein n=1 Tax=Choiromyces venosus 120613-1 TaxID=1336337 RepID=A0A3N4JRD3_9PEZI|nr:hypothetical protein L873DRAFT_747042 [Choiromyces venosus 120613-1]